MEEKGVIERSSEKQRYYYNFKKYNELQCGTQGFQWNDWSQWEIKAEAFCVRKLNSRSGE